MKKEEVQNLKDLADEYLEKYLVAKKKLQETCEHDWETFRAYDGTLYSCKVCGKNES